MLNLSESLFVQVPLSSATVARALSVFPLVSSDIFSFSLRMAGCRELPLRPLLLLTEIHRYVLNATSNDRDCVKLERHYQPRMCWGVRINVVEHFFL